MWHFGIYGLVGMTVLGRWLELMILEVFPNLWFYDQRVSRYGHSTGRHTASLAVLLKPAW